MDSYNEFANFYERHIRVEKIDRCMLSYTKLATYMKKKQLSDFKIYFLPSNIIGNVIQLYKI